MKNYGWLGWTLMKKKKQIQRGKWISAETVIDADNSDDLVLLANTPAQSRSLLHSLEQAARDVSLYVNSDKTEFILINMLLFSR